MTVSCAFYFGYCFLLNFENINEKIMTKNMISLSRRKRKFGFQITNPGYSDSTESSSTQKLDTSIAVLI